MSVKLAYGKLIVKICEKLRCRREEKEEGEIVKEKGLKLLGLVLIMGNSRMRRKSNPVGRQHSAFRN